jgi:Ser-tRNA(Ala) deacylase AlaX
VLFPEGGGQPTDIGILASEDGVIWDVELVKRHGGVAVHYIKLPEDVSVVPDAFAPGKQASVELGHAGFQRRLDHVSLVTFLCSYFSEAHHAGRTFFLDEHAHRTASSFFCHRY